MFPWGWWTPCAVLNKKGSIVTTQIWVVTRHQCRISALVSRTSFAGETSGSVTKCWLFSQASAHHLFLYFLVRL